MTCAAPRKQRGLYTAPYKEDAWFLNHGYFCFIISLVRRNVLKSSDVLFVNTDQLLNDGAYERRHNGLHMLNTYFNIFTNCYDKILSGGENCQLFDLNC